MSANQYAGIKLVEPLINPSQGLLSNAENILYKGYWIIIMFLFYSKILEGRDVFEESAFTVFEII